MPRGQASVIGEERVSQNGYRMKRTADGWRPVHYLIMEGVLGRSIRDGERVIFKDRNRENLEPSNLMVVPVGVKTLKALHSRRDEVGRRIKELEAEYADLTEKIRIREEIVSGDAEQQSGTV